MKRAVLLTGHFPDQHRKPSMLWVSHHLQQMEWHVTHATVGYSVLSRLTRDQRLTSLENRPCVGAIQRSGQLTTLFGYSPLHPVSTRLPLLDTALAPLQKLFTAYWEPRLRTHLAKADLVIVESGAPVMLAQIARHLAPQARLIYRVNDDLRLLKAPSCLLRAERRAIPLFDRVSTASPHLARHFDHPTVTLDPMGVPKELLKVSTPDPYKTHGAPVAICAGTTQIDLSRLIRIAIDRPTWQLHVLGRLKSFPETPDNLTLHGEVSFETNLAYIAHANIGLAAYNDTPGVEYQTHNSNRILLYRQFGLPVLGPDRLCHPSVPCLIGYSDPQAYQHCETWTKSPETLPDWRDLTCRLAQNGVIEPPELASKLPETT